MIARTILLVDDDENDAFLFQHAAEKAGVEISVHVVTDGQEAIDYLSNIGSFSDRAQHPFPALVVLDLNLPQKHGLEVLKWIRKTSRCTTLPVLVLTSSNLDLDVTAAYRLGANSFFVKPGDPEQLRRMITVITNYWFDSAVMPPVLTP